MAMAALGAALILAYVTVLRFDLSMVPLAIGTMTAAGALARGVARAYPGALAGAVDRRAAGLRPRLVVVRRGAQGPRAGGGPCAGTRHVERLRGL